MDPYYSSHRLYSDLKPNGQLFFNGGDPYRYDSGCELDFMPVSCSVLNQLIRAGWVERLLPDGRRVPVDMPLDGLIRTGPSSAPEWNDHLDYPPPEQFETKLISYSLGPIVPTGPNPQKTGPHLGTVKKAIYDCIQGLWKGVAQLVSFDPTTKGKDGKASITIFDSPGSIKEFATVHNSVKFPSGTLGYFYNASRGLTGTAGPLRGFTGYGSYKYELEAETLKFSPYVNYTASDVQNFGAYFQNLANKIGDFQETQIHELGNSIRGLTGMDVGDINDPHDTDSGQQLSKCVNGKL